MECAKCGSSRMHKKELTKAGKRRYRCYDCDASHYEDESLVVLDREIFAELNSVADVLPGRLVVTSAIVGVDINENFLLALESYCEKRNAVLTIIPIKNGDATMEEWSSRERIQRYFLTKDWYFNGKFKIIAECSIVPTAGSPLSGMDALSESMTTIIAHPQLQMKTVAVNPHRDHVILTTTGSISVKTEYSVSKAGYRAEFNHCFAALTIEREANDNFHLRQLLADHTGGFYDLLNYYHPSGDVSTQERVEALVTGDEHVIFVSPEVRAATYDASDSIVNTLRPKVIVRHDVLDCFSITHHHDNAFLKRYKKLFDGMNSIGNELDATCDFIVSTTPENTVSWIVDSNHNNHLTRWLNSADAKNDIPNARVYHFLMWKCLKAIEDGRNADPFRLYFNHWSSPEESKRVEFIEANTMKEVAGVTVSMHGDIGPNGSRGSRMNLARIGERCVIGHSHSPGIERGCWQVGTSSLLAMEYNSGPSSWMNTHCIIHKNGKRQLINIIDGKWKAD